MKSALTRFKINVEVDILGVIWVKPDDWVIDVGVVPEQGLVDSSSGSVGNL